MAFVLDWNTVTYIIIIFVAVAGLFLFIWNEMRHNIRVVIKEITATKKRVIEDKARVVTDDNGHIWWRLKRERDRNKRFMPIPIDESIEVTRKGKLWHETYRTQLGEYIPIIDTSKVQEVPAEIRKEMNKIPAQIDSIKDQAEKAMAIQKHRNNILLTWMQDENIASPLKPYNATQRATYLMSVKKAEERKIKDWKKDLPIYMAIGSMAFIIIIALIFLPDVITAVKGLNAEHQKQIAELEELRHKNVLEEIQRQKEVTQNLQNMNERINNLENKAPN